jgi:hypothetical protein
LAPTKLQTIIGFVILVRFFFFIRSRNLSRQGL